MAQQYSAREMERAKEKLAHSLVGRRLHAKQRALPHELADRAAREENEAKAAAKKNTQLRRKQAKRQHERQEAHRRLDGYRSRTHPEPPQRVRMTIFIIVLLFVIYFDCF